MEFAELCKKYFPHLEVVVDFTKSPYAHITLDDRMNMSQKDLQKIVQAEQEYFSKSRDPSCFGGSDIGTIMGEGFISPSMLAAEKQGLYKRPVTPEQQELFDTGHMAEPMIRQGFERRTGMRTIECPVTMVNPKYPFFRMNIDGLILHEGSIGIYEGKWTRTWRIIKDHYELMKKVRDKGAEPSIALCPKKYLYQVWGYEAGWDLDWGYLCGGWGYSDEQIGYVRIPRLPKDKEEWLMQTCEEFMRLVNAGKIPSDADFVNKTRLEELYEEMAPAMPETGNVLTLASADAEAARHYLELKKEMEALEESMKEQVDELTERFMEENGMQAKKETLRDLELYFKGELLQDHEAVASDETGKYRIRYSLEPGRNRTFQSKLCREKYPELMDEIIENDLYVAKPKRVLSIEDVGGER